MSSDAPHVIQFYTKCVAEAAYYLEHNGEAAIVDPLRDFQQYIDEATQRGAKIKYVLETHFHADFVSGHVELAKATGATIVYGPLAEPHGFQALIATDGQELPLGGSKIKVLHTPGHTMESSCFVLIDPQGKQKCVFTGDTLFIGDVGRPDLAQKGPTLTEHHLATYLFHSLRDKIMTLPDDIVVYPGHGAGSACGKNMSSETFDTLKGQKETNYALRANMTVEEFIREVTSGLDQPPEYFPANVAMNKGVIELPKMQQLIDDGNKRLSVDEVEAARHLDPRPLLIDTRDVSAFAAGHIPHSIFVGIDDGTFGPWVATAFPDLSRPVIVIPKSDERTNEIVTRLARFGFEKMLGHLAGGFAAWVAAGKEVATITNVTPDEMLAAVSANPDENLLVDVRKPGEYRKAHHRLSINMPLSRRSFQELDTSKNIYAHCAAGYRSLVFISGLLDSGRPHRGIYNVLNGFWGIQQSDANKEHLVLAPCDLEKKQLM